MLIIDFRVLFRVYIFTFLHILNPPKMLKVKPVSLSQYTIKRVVQQTNKPKNLTSCETPRKRKSLTAAQKKDICLKKQSMPSLKNKDLAKKYDVSEGMISDILKAKDRWLAIDSDSYQAGLRREKKLPFPNIEEALSL